MRLWRKYKEDETEQYADNNDEGETELDDIVDEVSKLKKSFEILSKSVTDLIKSLTVVDELRREITELKSDLKNQNDFMQTVIMRLIDKPIAPPTKSALEQYKEQKAVAASSNSATAGPKGKLP